MEIAGYSPGDFLLFAPETYWRLFLLMNRALWPAPLAAAGLGALVWLALLRPRAWTARAAAALLALGWAAAGQGFLATWYAPVNWAAGALLPAFHAQAALLLLAAVWPGRIVLAPAGGAKGALALAVLGAALLLHPLLAPLSGRPLMGAEIAGLAPDPTALATLGLAGWARSRARGLLIAALPVLWCTVSVATLLTLGAWQGWLLAGLAVAGAAALALPPGHGEIASLRQR